MGEYDATLKLLFKDPAAVMLRILANFEVTRWLDLEMKAVQERTLDLLAEAADGRLLHIELQSRNDSEMPLRMMRYGAMTGLQFKGRYPIQVLLYVGKEPLRMAGDYTPNGDPVFHFKVVDIRDVNAKALLDSDRIGDNILAVLADSGHEQEAIKEVVRRIAALGEAERRSKLEQLSILAGLRQAGHLVKEEASRMPITESILDHDLLGPIYKKGIEEGRQEGRHEGELLLLRRQIAKRFGPLPAWLEERLQRCTVTELEKLSDRFVDAASLEDLLP